MVQLNTGSPLRKSSSGEDFNNNTLITPERGSGGETTGVTEETQFSSKPEELQRSPSIVNSSESSEDLSIEGRIEEEPQKKISLIYRDLANHIANAIREADYEAHCSDFDMDAIDFITDSSSKEELSNSSPSALPLSIMVTESEDDINKRKERIKVFCEIEKKIYLRAMSILHQDSKVFTIALEELKKSGGRKIPSLAILNLAKDINAQPRAIELLTVIIDCYYYEDSREFLDQDVSLDASFLIFNYYLDAYNSMATKIENPEQIDRNLHGLLQLCHTHIPDHWAVDLYDPTEPLCHIHDMINKQLLTFNLWYLENPTIFKTLPATERFFACELLNVFTLGMAFLKCTTYGAFDIFPDLAYILKLKGFIGVKQACRKPVGSFQHIWNHPRIPLQVRISQNGKLTVGILRDIPLDQDKQLIKNAIGVDEDNELLKISHPDIASYSIPARHKKEWAQELWLNNTNHDSKKELMAEAHRHLEPRDMKFDKVDHCLNPDAKPKLEEKNNQPSAKTKPKKKNVRQKK